MRRYLFYHCSAYVGFTILPTLSFPRLLVLPFLPFTALAHLRHFTIFPYYGPYWFYRASIFTALSPRVVFTHLAFSIFTPPPVVPFLAFKDPYWLHHLVPWCHFSALPLLPITIFTVLGPLPDFAGLPFYPHTGFAISPRMPFLPPILFPPPGNPPINQSANQAIDHRIHQRINH